MLNSRVIRDSDYMFDTKSFQLSPTFVEEFEDKQPDWGPLGYITFKRTYARPLGDGTTEEFWQTINRVVNGVFTIQKQWCKQLGLPWSDARAQKTAQKMFKKMWDFKMIAPGRGLWIMGTDFIEKNGSAALNNCFAYETEIITEQGVKQIGDCAGTTQRLLTEGGRWVDAPVSNFGKQKLMKLVLTRQGKKKTIYVTKDHRWFCRTKREKEYKELVTKELVPGIHIFKYIFGQNAAHSQLVKPSTLGVMHGICYGDGTSVPGGRNSNILQLFEEKRNLSEFFPKNDTEEKEDRTVIKRLPNYFRELPELSENTSYLLGWMMGYFATDGSVSNGQVTLASYDLNSLVFVKNLCYKIGVGTYDIVPDRRKSNFDGVERDSYKLTFMASFLTLDFFLRNKHRLSYSSDRIVRYWSLESVEDTDRCEEVYCATVENTGNFALSDNILTGNCAFTSTEDIDIKNSKAFEFLMDMSMLGVGVGFDTLGAGKITIKEPKENGVYQIPDSREGWVESLKKLLDAYFLGKPRYTYDYSLIREEGSPIKGFGGLSAGPAPLKRLLEDVEILLRERVGQPIKSTDIVDIMNMIGRCVVAGNVRRCLPEGTLIHTKEGLVRVENILPGMLAKTSDGYAEISELIPQGKQKTIAIRTQLGVFECTKKHKVAKMTGIGKYSWVMAQDLKKGDRLTFIDSGIEGEKTSLPDFSYKKSKHSTTCKNITIPELDPDMAWFLGLFHGDGYTYPNFSKNGFNAYVSVACSPDYPKIIEDCQKQIKRFGVALCDTLPSTKDKSHKVRAQSKQLAWYLSRFKQASTSISIPDFILKGTRDIRAAYVIGLFDSDGGKHNRPIIAASSIYPEYLSEVQALYASLGIPTRIKMHRKPAGSWKALYHLTIVGEKTKKDFFAIAEKYSRCFESIIRNATSRSQHDFGFPSEWIKNVPFKRTWDRSAKQMTLSCLTACGVDYKNMVPVEVLGICENDLEVTTYDISVPGKKEFVCQDGLLVHNSAEIALGLPEDVEFLTMKQDAAKLESHRWASNNSILARSHMDYGPIVESVWKNGEPGIVWLENAQKYGRLKDGITWADKHAKGVNPCFSGDSKLRILKNGSMVEAEFRDIVGQTVDIPSPFSKNTVKTEIVETGAKATITVKMSNNISFRCTPDHVFRTSDDKDIQAKDTLGISLMTLSQELCPVVTSIEPYGVETVYDFKMESIHWGYVNGVVAHNCGEQTLESFELCCVSGDTKIQTISGVYSISSLVGKPVEVWNGDSWSLVTPFVAGANKDLYRIFLSDGSYLDCTEDHGWYIKGKTKKIYKKIDTKDLTVGDRSIPFSLGDIQGNFEPYAYEYGLFSGDGFIDNDRPMFCAYGEKAQLKDLGMHGIWYKEQTKEGYSDPFSRASFKGVLDLDRCQELNDKNKGLPEWVFEMDRASILEFVAGLLDTDGNVCNQINTDNFRIFGNEEKVSDLQILLRRVGIDHATTYLVGEAGEETNFGTRNYSVYCCYIPSYECGEIPGRIRKATKIGSRYRVNNAYPDGQKIDAALKQRVVKIEKLGGKHTTYCFSEPENHMGVFGNVLTFQCLVESFPSRHDSYEEFEDTLKMAYLYAKSVTLVNTHWAETNAVMLKNRRMGISQTGIINAIGRHGLTNMLEWCDKGYAYLRGIDEQYSAWLCVPLSKKLTTVKPSGTVSLLAGVSAGIHYPHSKHYIRRIRFDVNSEYLPMLRDAGYRTEQDVYSQNSVCVEFPIEEPFFTIGKNDVTVWEQLENAGMYQYHWSDNQVSITVTFKESEKQDLKRALEYFEHRLKCVSLLPNTDNGYKQMPYETITEKEYKAYVAKIKPMTFSKKKLAAGKGERFCSNDSCEIKIG